MNVWMCMHCNLRWTGVPSMVYFCRRLQTHCKPDLKMKEWMMNNIKQLSTTCFTLYILGLHCHAFNHRPNTKISDQSIRWKDPTRVHLQLFCHLNKSHELWMPRHDATQSLSCAVTLFTVTSDEHILWCTLLQLNTLFRLVSLCELRDYSKC